MVTIKPSLIVISMVAFLFSRHAIPDSDSSNYTYHDCDFVNYAFRFISFSCFNLLE